MCNIGEEVNFFCYQCFPKFFGLNCYAKSAFHVVSPLRRRIKINVCLGNQIVLWAGKIWLVMHFLVSAMLLLPVCRIRRPPPHKNHSSPIPYFSLPNTHRIFYLPIPHAARHTLTNRFFFISIKHFPFLVDNVKTMFKVLWRPFHGGVWDVSYHIGQTFCLNWSSNIVGKGPLMPLIYTRKTAVYTDMAMVATEQGSIPF